MIRTESVGELSDESQLSHVVDDDEEEQSIAKRETATVIYLKLIVAVVLISSAIGATVAVFRYTRSIEQAKFQDTFRSDAQKVVEAIDRSFEKTLSSFDSLAVSFISHAMSSNSTWPFVTLPNFAVRAAKILPASNSLFISVVPLVRANERLDWEAYASKHDNWVNESLEIQKTWDGYYGPSVEEWSPIPKLFYLEETLPYNAR
jgi:hypothetical protein